jgi:hypothetical protein
MRVASKLPAKMTREYTRKKVGRQAGFGKQKPPPKGGNLGIDLHSGVLRVVKGLF